jgi:hypothetical protein
MPLICSGVAISVTDINISPLIAIVAMLLPALATFAYIIIRFIRKSPAGAYISNWMIL